jgi:hypothetical protein
MTATLPFDFARDLRKPEIRDRLRLLKFDGEAGDVAMIWYEDECYLDACRRAPVDVRRTLLVWPNAESLGGWGMRWAEDVER